VARVSADHPERVDIALVAGGRWHDIDYARLQLLDLLAEHHNVRTTVVADYEALPFDRMTAMISYTCDVRPSEQAQRAVADWVAAGHRWVALHGTNAALDLPRPNGVESPRCFPLWAQTLGSQFVAHPPLAPYLVEAAPLAIDDPDRWLIENLDGFETNDELYLSEYHGRDRLKPLLTTSWQGIATGFAEDDWSTCDPIHLVSYLKPVGEGLVLYNTLGHCRAEHDMVPLMQRYPVIERGSWEVPAYRELLRRAIRWAIS
jgi:uncharacterized protein